MKKALIFQTSAAIGDRIFISWVPKQLHRRCGYDKVDCFTRKVNGVLWDNNPHVSKQIYLEDFGKETTADVLARFEKEYDRVFDFRYKVEGRYIKFSHEDYGTLEMRRKKAEGKCWYDVYDDFGLYGKNGEIYLTQAEIDRNKKFREDGKIRVLWQPMGSGRNKVLTFLPAYIAHVAEKYPKTEHWIMGSDGMPISQFPKLPNIKDVRAKFTVREAFTMVPIFDLVVGSESSFVNAAGVFDVPSVCFANISSQDNLARFFKYCTFIKPMCDCYPCLIIANEWRTVWDLDKRARSRDFEIGCMVNDPKDRYRMLGYKCTTMIDHVKAMDTIIGKMFDRNFKLAG
jgi:ADP-heptose:LPS heptosyltransferase